MKTNEETSIHHSSTQAREGRSLSLMMTPLRNWQVFAGLNSHTESRSRIWIEINAIIVDPGKEKSIANAVPDEERKQ